YLISIESGGEELVYIKYIQKSEIPDHVRLVSYNEHHQPKDIHKKKIQALALVKASIRINSMY
ncbi:MAG: S24 family peptidase, partial [Sphingobacteriaceae bacterium]